MSRWRLQTLTPNVNVIRCITAGVQSGGDMEISGETTMINHVMGTATPKISIPVNNSTIPVITYRGKRVVTTESLASGYGTTPVRIQQNFARNEHRFIEGKHFFKISGEELKSFRLSFSESVNKHTTSLVLWTERGASRHAKMLETEQAWDFFEELEDTYFNVREVHGVMLPDMSDPVMLARAWADAIEEKRKAVELAHQQADYIEHLESLFTDGLSPVQFCKRLNGVNTSKVNAWLQSVNWLYDDNHEGRSAKWRVRSYARDKYLTEKSHKITPSDSASFTSYQPVLLREGAIWIYRKYLKNQLPMKQRWNGQHTHDKELAGGVGV